MPRHATRIDHGPLTPLSQRIQEAGSRFPSMRAFGRACDVEYQSLWRYAKQNVVPGPLVLARIAKGSGVRVEWLLTGEGPKSSARARVA